MLNATKLGYSSLQNFKLVLVQSVHSVQKQYSGTLVKCSTLKVGCKYSTTSTTSEINSSINKLALEIGKSVSDDSRIPMISTLLHTLESLTSQDEQCATSFNEDSLMECRKPSNSAENPSSLELPLRKLSETNKDLNKYFAHSLQRIVSVIQTHHRLTNGELDMKNTTEILKSLHGNIGFGLKNVVRLLHYYPEIFEIDAEILNDRIQNLRNHNLKEGFLQRSLSLTPRYFTLTRAQVEKTAEFLIGSLDFKTSELPQLFLYSPQVFFDPHNLTEDKFHYIYFTMGYKKHYVIARHGILRYSLPHIRTRHLFLERRGLFQVADKNRKTTIFNPKMKSTLCTSDKTFCADVALCPLQEYSLFKKMIQVEDALREEDVEYKGEESTVEDTGDLADKLLMEMK